MSRTIIAVVLAYLIVPITFASANEIWTCTYPGFSKDRRPVIVRYKQRGESMMEDEWNQEYRILQNNQFGIVATSSISRIETNQNKSGSEYRCSDHCYR